MRIQTLKGRFPKYRENLDKISSTHTDVEGWRYKETTTGIHVILNNELIAILLKIHG